MTNQENPVPNEILDSAQRLTDSILEQYAASTARMREAEMRMADDLLEGTRSGAAGDFDRAYATSDALKAMLVTVIEIEEVIGLSPERRQEIMAQQRQIEAD